jgi:MFS family permease
MATIPTTSRVRWWKEPTKDQWMAWWAAWLGWTLDAFDFTVFLLIMVPISKEFNVLTVTLWMRLVGACGSGWLADRGGRKAPPVSSVCGTQRDRATPALYPSGHGEPAVSLRTLFMSGLARQSGDRRLLRPKNEAFAGRRPSNSGSETLLPGLAAWSVGAQWSQIANPW